MHKSIIRFIRHGTLQNIAKYCRILLQYCSYICNIKEMCLYNITFKIFGKKYTADYKIIDKMIEIMR